LPLNFKIARTKQANDIGSLNNRQTNYTQKLKLPKVKETIVAFDNLGVTGNVSRKPYERNRVFLYNDDGQSEIYNGWAIINSTDNYYNVTIYDGVIDFYKAIENKVITDIGVSELNHTKNTATVLNSWTASSPYRYIVSDYGGKTTFNDGVDDILNIDYLVPSVNVKWLWNKIFSFFEFTYTGDVFLTEEFTNLWMTFPKGLSNSEIVPELIYTNDTFTAISAASDVSLYLVHTAPSPSQGSFLANSAGFTVPSNATYVFNTIGSLTADFELQNDDIVFDVFMNGYIAVNPFNLSNDPPVNLYPINTGGDTLIPLQEGDVVYYYYRYEGGQGYSSIANLNINLTLTYSLLQGDAIDFENALINFKVKDFLNEVLWRFGLTPFKDKYTNNINFLTYSQLIQNTNYYDWSDRFVGVKGESYMYSNYAQVNKLKYQYNDKESEYNDGELVINNKNLDEETTVIASKIYTRDLQLSIIFDDSYNVYSLWDAQPKELTNGTIEINYKSKDKRFYFLRSETVNKSIYIGSESLTEKQSISEMPRESYYRLPFQDVVQDYYTPIYGILNDSKLENILLRLDDNLVSNIEFSRLVYIKQLADYFLINKIPNYINKGVYSVQSIRVKYTSIIQSSNNFATITDYTGGNLIFALNNYTEATLTLQVSIDNGATWNNGSISSVSPHTVVLTIGQIVRLKHINEDLYSNIYEI
jgi:hypothetical protein